MSQEYPVNIPVKVTGADAAEQSLKKVSKAGDEAEKSTSGLKGGLGKLTSAFDDVKNSSNDVSGSLRNLATSGSLGVSAFVALTGAAIAATVAFVANAKAMGELADANAETAEKLGITTKQLEVFNLITRENGGSAQSLVTAFDKVNKSVSDVNKGSNEAINAFRALGIEEKSLANLTQQEIAGKVIKNFEALGQSADATAAAQKILGESFREMLPSIKAATNNMDEYNRRVDYFGNTASSTLVQSGLEQKNAFEDLGMAVTALRNTFAEMSGGMIGDMARAAAEIVKLVNDIMKALDRLSGRNSVSDSANSIIDRLPGAFGFAARGARSGIGLLRGDQREQSDAETARLSRGQSAAVASLTPAIIPIAPIVSGGGTGGGKSTPRNPYKEMIDALTKRADLVNVTTELEKIQWENANGASKNFTDMQKLSLENTAKQIDLKNALAQKDRDALKAAEDERKEQEKKTAELEKQITRQNEIAQRGAAELANIGNNAMAQFGSQVATTGMGSTDRETFALMAENANKAKLEIAALDSTLAGHNDRVKLIRDTEAAVTEQLRDTAEKRKEYAMDWTNGAKNAIGDYLDYVTDSSARMNEIWGKGMKGMEDALTDFATTGKMNFKDLISSILQDIIRFIIQKTVMAPIVAGLKSVFGFADGGAFSGGSQIQAFADGGVVSGPTMFPMTGGKTGLMGEAGPEAIMPLKRTASGALGVQVTGGGSGSGVQIGSISIVVQGGKTNEETGNALTASVIQAMERVADGRIMQAKRLGNMLNPI